MKDYEKSLTEVYEILKYLSKEDYKKIPKEVVDVIYNNKDNNYYWKYDTSKSLSNQNISREAIAVLSYINMEFLLDEEQKRLLEKIHKYNEMKLETEKEKEYDVNNLFGNTLYRNKQYNENNFLAEVKKDKWYVRIYKAFKNFFKKDKDC